MNHQRLTFVTTALLVLGLSASAAAQSSLTVDARLAKRGKSLWENKGCMICHRIGGGKAAGPDLGTVFERRSLEWLTRFLQDTPGMLENDSIAKELLVEWKNMRMPDMKLSDPDVDAVLHYLAQEVGKLGE